MLNKTCSILPVAAIAILSMIGHSYASDSNTTVRDHRTQPIVRDHRTQRKNEVVPSHQKKYDCSAGNVRLVRMGYVSVVAYDCDGALYHYTAVDGASLFRASMKAFTGEMTVTFVGIAN